MPRYFFDTRDGGIDIDPEGVELAGEEEALLEAIRYAGSLLNDQPSIWLEKPEVIVTVRSECRNVARLCMALTRST